MKNNWLDDEKQEQTRFYLNQANEFIIEREASRKILTRLFSYQFPEPKNLELLEIGSGNGYITKGIFDQYPDNHFTLIDGSPQMVEAARELFPGDNFDIQESRFETFFKNKPADLKFHFTYSANAIHHLNFLEKSSLYQEIFDSLHHDGLFLNFDVVLPPSNKCEAWAFQLWRDWARDYQIAIDSKTPHKHDGLPEIYKYKEENQPTGLWNQLELLQNIGFRNVDCYFKYGIFALFGGTK